MAENNQVISNILKQLAVNIKNNIQEYINEKIIEAQQEIYVYPKVTELEYNHNGLGRVNLSLNQKPKLYLLINDGQLEKKIKSYSEYISLIEEYHLQEDHVFQFIVALIHQTLKVGNFNALSLEDIVNFFIGDLEESPIKYKAYVALKGVIIDSSIINFNIDKTEITLRRVESKDLEIEYPAYSSRNNILHSHPSGILLVENYEADKLYSIICQSIVILVIFQVSSVSRISYKIYAQETILRNNDRIAHSNKNNIITSTLVITQEKASKLQKFWKDIINILPEELHNPSSNKKTTHLLVAFQHYCDALLQARNLEEKIAKAVIGLEALLVHENTEISFRFKIRGAKLLGILGKPTNDVQKILKIAYDIRSSYVHGDDSQLEKKIKKLEEEYPNTNDFVVKLLDILRILILVMIGLAQHSNFIQNNKGQKTFLKQKFLEMVDNALIDIAQEKELCDILEDAAHKVKLGLT